MSIQRYTVTEIDAFETLDQDAWCKGKDIAALELRVAELEAERNTLVETINAMNEVNIHPTDPSLIYLNDDGSQAWPTA